MSREEKMTKFHRLMRQVTDRHGNVDLDKFEDVKSEIEHVLDLKSTVTEDPLGVMERRRQAANQDLFRNLRMRGQPIMNLGRPRVVFTTP